MEVLVEVSAMRLIDATEAKEWAEKHILDAKERYTILDFLRECSTVDSVEVVRCAQCKLWSARDGGYMDDEPHCGNPDGIDGYTQADDFCSHGERKEV